MTPCDSGKGSDRSALADDRSPGTVAVRQSGVAFAVDERALVEMAGDADVIVELVPAVGDFVPVEGNRFRAPGAAPGIDEDRMRRTVVVARERNQGRSVGDRRAVTPDAASVHKSRR